MKFYVYELVKKSNGKVIYVGKGSGNRLNFHEWGARTGHTKQQPKLYAQLAALLAVGDSFYARKVFESDDEHTVLEKEIATIKHYGIENLFNGVSAHLFGAIDGKRAQAVREAISRARTGMKFSDEHRRNISLASKGRKKSPEAILASSSAQIGRKHKKHSHTLPEAERHERRLATYQRHYLKRRERELARLKIANDSIRLEKWKASLQEKGLPLDTPLPPIIGPLAHLTPEQRLERKRARERLNHALREAKAANDAVTIKRLQAERQRLDEF